MIKLFDIAFILSMSIAFFSKVNRVTVIGEDICFSIMLFWEILALCELLLRRMKGKKSDNTLLSILFKLNNYVRIIIYLYTIILIVIGLTETRFFSTNLRTFINGISAIAAVYLFGKKVFKYAIISLALSYCYSIIAGVIMADNLSFETLVGIFELHDIAFGTGFVIIYFMCIKEKWHIKNIKIELLAMLIFILAYKRIGIVALLIALMCWWFLKCFSSSDQIRFTKLFGWMMIISCYLFVFFIVSGELWKFLEIIDVNMSGRSYYYKIVSDICKFNPSFLGLGRNALAVIFAEDYAYFKVGNVHSDILRMYAECGFILFGIWLINYLILIPQKLGKIYGAKVTSFVFSCTIYLFIVYLTDNTELYLVNQYFYILTIIQYIYYTISLKEIKQKEVIIYESEN